MKFSVFCFFLIVFHDFPYFIGRSKRKYRDDDEGEENYEDEDEGDGDSPIVSKHWSCTVSEEAEHMYLPHMSSLPNRRT